MDVFRSGSCHARFLWPLSFESIETIATEFEAVTPFSWRGPSTLLNIPPRHPRSSRVRHHPWIPSFLEKLHDSHPELFGCTLGRFAGKRNLQISNLDHFAIVMS